MDALEFLSRPLQVSNALRKAQEKQAALKSLTERVTIPFGPESEPVSHSRNNAALQDVIILLSETGEEVLRLQEDLMDVTLRVGMVLMKLSDENLHTFMVARFLDFMTIRDAAETAGFSLGWGRLAQKRGVAEVQRILDEEEQTLAPG